MTMTHFNFPPTDDATIEAKAAIISQRIQEKLALERDLHTIEQAVVLRFIAAAKLAQGAYQLAYPLAQLDRALKELAEALDDAAAEAKANRERTEPMTFEEALALAEAEDA